MADGSSGDFVWTTDHSYGQVYNFQVQMYLGEPYLTFWAGDDAVDGHGSGSYYMVRHVHTTAAVAD